MCEDRHAVCIDFYSTSCTRNAFRICAVDVSCVRGGEGWRGRGEARGWGGRRRGVLLIKSAEGGEGDSPDISRFETDF